MQKAFIVCGAPGAGKTTYALRLAKQSKALVLDIDTVTERVVQAGMSAAGLDVCDRDSLSFKNFFREPIYETLFDIARENLPFLPAVIVGPFTKEIRDPDWPRQLADRLNAQIEVHYVYCPPEIRRQRLLLRDNPRDAAKLTGWDEYLKYYGDGSPPNFSHVFVDTSAELA